MNCVIRFKLLWLCQTLSSSAEFLFESTVTVWLLAGIFDESVAAPALASLLVLAALIPRVLVGAVSGAVVDSRDPGKALMLSSAIRAVIVAGAALGAIVFGAPAWLAVLALVAAAAVSSGTQFFVPARARVLQSIVEERDRVTASAHLSAASVVASVLFTALGPWLFAAVGQVPGLTLSALLFGGAAIAGARLSRGEVHAGKPATSTVRRVFEGLGFAWRTAEVRGVAWGMAIYGCALGIANSVLALFALETVRVPPGQYGLLGAAFALGSLVGVLVTKRLSDRIKLAKLFRAALFGLGGCYAIYALQRELLGAIALMALIGLLFGVFSVVQAPVLQSAVPNDLMGRVTSVMTPVLALSAAIGATVTGSVLSALPPDGAIREQAYRAALLAAACVLLIGGAALNFRRPAPRSRE